MVMGRSLLYLVPPCTLAETFGSWQSAPLLVLHSKVAVQRTVGLPP